MNESALVPELVASTVYKEPYVQHDNRSIHNLRTNEGILAQKCKSKWTE